MATRRVVLFMGSEGWIARWLEHDFVGQGISAELAVRNLHSAIDLHASLIGGENPFAEVPPSANDYWRMYEAGHDWPLPLEMRPSAQPEASGVPPPWMITNPKQ